MNIGIEATSAVNSRKAGVGCYAANLIRAMTALPEAHRYALYLRRADPAPLKTLELGVAGAAKTTVKMLEFPLLWAQFRLPLEWLRHPQDAYFFPSSTLPLLFLPKNSVVTVHDVAYRFFPECFSPALRFWLHVSTRCAVRRAAKIITVSEATRQDVLKYYHAAPDKVMVVHHGVHARFHPLAREAVAPILAARGLNAPYLLCIGTLQQRKNIPRLLEAFARLKTTDRLPHALVLVGQQYRDLPEHEIFQTIERLGLQRDVIWTGYVPEQEMPGLINGATAFVMPSLYEGFGMPALEAMACGAPVACSNASSLPEVAGDAALYFDPRNIEQIAEQLRAILTDRHAQEDLRGKGLMRARQFSWDACARKTLDILAESARN